MIEKEQFNITPRDVGRFVRAISTGNIVVVEPKSYQGLLKGGGCVFHWRKCPENFEYIEFRSGVAVKSATKTSFTITSEDIGRYVQRISTGKVYRVLRDNHDGQIRLDSGLDWKLLTNDLQYVNSSRDEMITPMPDRFDITENDLGRYVRDKKTGEVGKVRKDPGNGWLHPGIYYEWRTYRQSLEYVTVTPDTKEPPPEPTSPIDIIDKILRSQLGSIPATKAACDIWLALYQTGCFKENLK